jgi:hypothetical protein
MLSVVMLSVIILSVVLLIVVAQNRTGFVESIFSQLQNKIKRILLFLPTAL